MVRTIAILSTSESQTILCDSDVITNAQRVRTDGEFHRTRCRVVVCASRSELNQRRCTNIDINGSSSCTSDV